MTRVHNFSAGPAALPEPVLCQAQAELLDFRGSGMSVMEMSHRGKMFLDVAQAAENDFRTLLAIPEHYKVLFLQGGGRGEFAFVPMNFLGDRRQADYLDSGHWSALAIDEARRYCEVNVVASSAASGYTEVPALGDWRRTSGAAYLHLCTNETIHGVEFIAVPDESGTPIVADMSSHILSRVIEVERFGCIYGGAQKNIGPSGLTFVVVREDLLGRAHPLTPSVFNFAKQANAEWMLNTPPTFAVYLAGLTFKWLQEQGGVGAIERVNQAKAEMLYAAIDDSGGFYRSPVAPAWRSRMNVPFTLADERLTAPFLATASARGLAGLKGHKAVGGLRASLYNAVPLAAVEALVDCMREFQREKG